MQRSKSGYSDVRHYTLLRHWAQSSWRRVSSIPIVVVVLLAELLTASAMPIRVDAAAPSVAIPGVGQISGATGATQGLSAVSGDGTKIVVWSPTDLTGVETSGPDNDVYVYDTVAHIFTMASVPNGGGEANGDSTTASISSDGRYVLFTSTATNLVAGDTNGAADAFVRDLLSGTTTRASVSDSGGQLAAGITPGVPAYLSGDGHHVAFTSDDGNVVSGDANGIADVFVRNLTTARTAAITVAPGGAFGDAPSSAAGISNDGRVVLVTTAASNFVAGDVPGSFDAVVFDRDADANGIFDDPGTVTTRQANVDASGNYPYPGFVDLSGDGKHVAFQSSAVFVRDLDTGTTVQVDVTTSGVPADGSAYYSTSISDNGAVVTFWSGATNLDGGQGGLFAHDRDSDHDGVLDEAGATTTNSIMVGGLFGSLNGGGTVLLDYYTGSYTSTGGPIAQTITFAPLGNVTFGDANPVVNATASSGLTVVLSSTTPLVCGVSGNSVSLLKVGSCTIVATQPGGATYSPAPSVTRTFVIGKRPLTIVADDLTKTAGSLNPTLTWSLFGFASTQTLATSGITGAASCATSANKVSPVGTYPISCTVGTLAATNFSFAATVDATLTVWARTGRASARRFHVDDRINKSKTIAVSDGTHLLIVIEALIDWKKGGKADVKLTATVSRLNPDGSYPNNHFTLCTMSQITFFTNKLGQLNPPVLTTPALWVHDSNYGYATYQSGLGDYTCAASNNVSVTYSGTNRIVAETEPGLSIDKIWASAYGGFSGGTFYQTAIGSAKR